MAREIDVDDLIRRLRARVGQAAVRATPDEIARAEALIGTELPPLFRSIYAEVANGHFGPAQHLGSWLLPLFGRTKPQRGPADGVIDRYLFFREQDLETDLDGFENPLDPQAEGFSWPPLMLPIIGSGGGIQLAVDCSSPSLPVVECRPEIPRFTCKARSLAEWLDKWLAMKPLQVEAEAAAQVRQSFEQLRVASEQLKMQMERGRQCEADGKWSEAEAAYHAALALQPGDPDAELALCWLALRSERLQEAMWWGNCAVVKKGSAPEVRFAHMAVNIWQGHWQNERANFAALARSDSIFDHRLLASNQSQLAMVCRRLRAQGALGDILPLLPEASSNFAWKPWKEAIEAVLAGHEITSLKDSSARTIFRMVMGLHLI